MDILLFLGFGEIFAVERNLVSSFHRFPMVLTGQLLLHRPLAGVFLLLLCISDLSVDASVRLCYITLI